MQGEGQAAVAIIKIEAMHRLPNISHQRSPVKTMEIFINRLQLKVIGMLDKNKVSSALNLASQISKNWPQVKSRKLQGQAMAISIVILIFTMYNNSMTDTITDMHRVILLRVHIILANPISLKVMVTAEEIVRALQQ